MVTILSIETPWPDGSQPMLQVNAPPMRLKLDPVKHQLVFYVWFSMKDSCTAASNFLIFIFANK